MDRSLKKQIITAVLSVFLSSMMDQLTGFGQVSALAMLQCLFTSYGAIYETDLEKHLVKMMGYFDPKELLARLIKKLERGG